MYVLHTKSESELHKKHNKLPFLAERMKFGEMEKLVPNLKDKKAYVVHMKNLNLALKHGLILIKVYWVIRFDLSYWLKPCMILNTKPRMAAV